MHDGNYQNKVAFNCVENTVQKNMRNIPANVFVDHAPTSWRIQDAGNRVFDRFDKPELKIRIVLAVVSRCGFVFR